MFLASSVRNMKSINLPESNSMARDMILLYSILLTSRGQKFFLAQLILIELLSSWMHFELRSLCYWRLCMLVFPQTTTWCVLCPGMFFVLQYSHDCSPFRFQLLAWWLWLMQRVHVDVGFTVSCALLINALIPSFVIFI